MKLPLSVIILTCNEEEHIGRCLQNVTDLADEIFVIDSFSTDKTLEIAKKYDAKILQHQFENQAEQFNWALNNAPIESEWILRLDADEYLTEELKNEILKILPQTPQNVSGFLMKRRVYFIGRWIKHGGFYPFWFLRLFRKGSGRCEAKEMDEHVILTNGVAAKLQNDFIDDNKKGIDFWIKKHVSYAEREAADIISGKKQKSAKTLYLKFPLFLRVFLYFLYRYVLRLGFLDGKEGLIFHFLQGCWYRFLVDAKIYESRK